MEKHIIVSEDGTALTLPVTPGEYNLPGTMNTKVVDLAQGGEYLMVGHEKLGTLNLDAVLIPLQQYSFCSKFTPQETARLWLERQRDEKRVLHYTITEANFDFQCKLITAEFGERDGTGDLYANLVFHKFTKPMEPTMVGNTSATAAASRDEPLAQSASVTEHTVKSGDNLWTICRKFYSDGTLYGKLASYNGIKNANLIHPGQVLKIPPKSELGVPA